MKLLQFAALAGVSLASLAQMKSDMRQLLDRYVRGLMESGEAANRNLPEILGASLDNINEYGCWCYFMDDHGRGHAKPVDGIDRFCRKLHMGYDCAMMDVIDATGNDTCIPWEAQYISGIGGGESQLVTTCEAFNSDLCATIACKVEGIFVIRVLQLFLGSGQVTEEFKHSNGFNEKDECIIEKCHFNDPTKCDVNRLCCGEHPDRFPYKPMGGDRGCCAGVAFDASILECCPDGTPRLSC